MIKVRNNNILVEVLQEDLKVGDIYIPETYTSTGLYNSNHIVHLIGKVVDQGKNNKDTDGKEYPFITKIGDLVVIEKNVGIPYNKHNKNFLILTEPDLLLILKK